MNRGAFPFIVLALVGPAVQAQIVGWRTDGQGIYSESRSPLVWSNVDNVIWKTPMPSWSNASPVVVGGRLFVLGEKASLLCLDQVSGQILWQASNSYQEVLSRQALKKLTQDAQDAKTELERELARVEAELKDAPGGRAGQPLRNQAKQLRRLIKENNPFELPPTHGDNGYSSATAISDGQHVWAVYGTGVVVCYDRDGHRQWARFVQKPTHRWGHSASPRLIDGKLIVAIIDLFALDPQDGRTLWRTASKEHFGTSAVVHVGSTPLIFTPAGQIVQAGNGQVLYDQMPKMNWNGPIVVGDTVFCIEDTSSAWRLPKTVGASFEPENLWTTRVRGSRHYASPVVHEGLVYTISREEKLSVLDAMTGKLVYWRDMELGGVNSNSAYSSVSMAAGHLIVASLSGQFAVFKPGREYHSVARNQLEPLRSTPVFIDNWMYVRGLEHVYCIGRTATAAR